jgi:hypothetical protein
VVPAAEHSFRRSDRDEPTLARGGRRTCLPDLALQRLREPLWRVIVVATVGFLLVAGLLVSLVMAPVWIVAAVRTGSLSGGAAVRFLPLGALAAVAAFTLPLAAVGSSGMTGAHRLASPGPTPSRSSWEASSSPCSPASASGPAFAREARPSCACTRADLRRRCCAGRLLAIGWIGIRTWTL